MWKSLGISKWDHTERRDFGLNGRLQLLSADRSSAFALRGNALLCVDLETLHQSEYPILDSNYVIDSVEKSVDGTALSFIAAGGIQTANYTIGRLSLEDMHVEKSWLLEEDEFGSSVMQTCHGECFLTGLDDRISNTTRLRSAISGEVVWDFNGVPSIPINYIERFVRYRIDYEIDGAVSFELYDYEYTKITVQKKGNPPFLVRSSPSGRFFSVETRTAWSINASEDGEPVFEGSETSRLFFSPTSDIAVRLFGTGRKNQRVEVYDLRADLPKLLCDAPSNAICDHVVFSEDHCMLLLCAMNQYLQFEVVQIDIVGTADESRSTLPT